MKYQKIVVGIDQSYKRTGISVAADGELKKISYIGFVNCKTNTDKRNFLRWKLKQIVSRLKNQAEKIIVIFERVRLRSQGFLSMDYIQAISALNAVIVDVCSDYEIKCYSVDTRAWKAAIVGTTKSQNNNYGVDPKKWLTVKFIIKSGRGADIKIKLPEKSKIKKCFEKNGERFVFNDDAADSACIALFGFSKNSKSKLREEH